MFKIFWIDLDKIAKGQAIDFKKLLHS